MIENLGNLHRVHSELILAKKNQIDVFQARIEKLEGFETEINAMITRFKNDQMGFDDPDYWIVYCTYLGHPVPPR